jgi:serpin B
VRRILLCALFTSTSILRATPEEAATAVNHLGLDILKTQNNPGENTLVSPYSIQMAMAMTFLGAAGETAAEMAKGLHYPENPSNIHENLSQLEQEIKASVTRSEKHAAEKATAWKNKKDFEKQPLQILIANRLFGQKDHPFRDQFIQETRTHYNAPLERVDFKKNPELERQKINLWVQTETRDRIKDLIPPSGVSSRTRLALVNALYFKAPWKNQFKEQRTQEQPFHLNKTVAIQVPTMEQTEFFGYSKTPTHEAITLPYQDGELQFLILLPNETTTLADFEKNLNPAIFADNAKLTPSEIRLYLPKIKISGETLALDEIFIKDFGIKQAFNIPIGSADFRLMTDATEEPLYISKVFHKTFLELDEKGTEAAAATAVVMAKGMGAMKHELPPEVRVNRPFLFAIQHQQTGACLFIGRVLNPAR